MDATCPNLRRLLPSCLAAPWALKTTDVTPKVTLFRVCCSFGVTVVDIEKAILSVIFCLFLLVMKRVTNGTKAVRPETQS